jgi:hypothetical protein
MAPDLGADYPKNATPGIHRARPQIWTEIPRSTEIRWSFCDAFISAERRISVQTTVHIGQKWNTGRAGPPDSGRPTGSRGILDLTGGSRAEIHQHGKPARLVVGLDGGGKRQ